MSDALIVGGGVAGLQAALTIARLNYTVTVIDAGEPRHRFATQMHNLIGADGETPELFYARARAQLAQYPTITLVKGRATQATREGAAFAITLADGSTHRSGQLLFACGLRDGVPPIAGLPQLWGRRVLNCLYCHGYELRQKQLGWLLQPGETLALLDNLLPLDAQIRLFCYGATLTPAELALAQQLGVAVESSAPVRAEETGDGMTITLADGTTRFCDALFLQTLRAPASELPQLLGCPVDAAGFLEADAYGRTAVANLYLAGDLVAPVHQLCMAVASGFNAARSVLAALNAHQRQQRLQA